MRVSSLQIFNIANKSMADVNEAIQKTQEQMSTGKRVLTPADDPVASTKILQLTDELSSIEQYIKNIDIAQNNIELEESILNNVNAIVLRMQELAVAAGNTATLTDNDYRAMASEVGARLDEMLNLVNSRNANGDFIFGGYKSTEEPFTGNANAGFNYRGDDGQQYIKIAHNTKVASTDSGKEIFMDIDSDNVTIDTYSSPANQSSPAAQISVGQVVDQETYQAFYPKDIAIAFNPDSNLVPAAKNYTVYERASGRVIVADQPYVPGDDIVVQGVSFRISGSPVSGVAATPALQAFGADAPLAFPVNFSGAASETFTVTVGGRTERLVLDGNITNVNDMVAILNNVANGNAAKLANLGVNVDAQGFHMPLGVNIAIGNGTANIDNVMGLNTSTGTVSDNGVLESKGDRFFVDSTEKQGLLTTLSRFKDIMENFDGTQEGRDQLSEVINSTLNNLSNAQTSILDVQSQLGARLNTLDSARNLHLDTEQVSRGALSDLRDLDYAEAATILSQQTLILQAAQQSFIRVSQLNLFARL